MSKKMYLASVLLILLIVPSIAFAQMDFVPSISANDVFALFFGPNIPEFMMYDAGGNISAYLVLQWLIFPFLSLWVILYGILTEIKIFRSRPRMNGVLALLIALIAGPTGGLVYFVRIIFVAFGIYGFALFAGLLFIGVTLWAIGRYRLWKPSGTNVGDAAKKLRNLADLDKRIDFYENRAKASWLTEAERREALAEFKRLSDERHDKFGK